MLKGKITKIENNHITVLLEDGNSYQFNQKILQESAPQIGEDIILLASLSKSENVAQSELGKVILNLLLDNQE